VAGVIAIGALASGLAFGPGHPTAANAAGHPSTKHIAPTRPAAQPGPLQPAATSPDPLAYRGGPVDLTPGFYVIFWGAEWQAGFTDTGGFTNTQAQTYLVDFFSALGGSPWLGSTGEYCQDVATGATSCPMGANSVPNPSAQFKGAWIDTLTPVPQQPTESDVDHAATDGYNHFKDATAAYMIIGPPGKNEALFASQATGGFCAWHDSVPAATPAPFGYIPYMPDGGSLCGRNDVNKTNDSYGHGWFDGFSIMGGHEYAEILTDPAPNKGWVDSTPAHLENGDKCQWSTTYPAQNLTLGSNYWAVQPLWSNSAAGCVTDIRQLYALDGFGGLHSIATVAGPTGSAYWPGWTIARGVAIFRDGTGGYVADGFGGLHPFGSAPTLSGYDYWPNSDIVRGVALAPYATAGDPEGWTLDLYGGLHPFGGAPRPSGGAYWPGLDAARAVVIGPDSKPGAVWGYVLDIFGGVHGFGGAPAVTGSAYWPGMNFARGMALPATDTLQQPGGYVVDGYGVIHPFAGAPSVTASASWPGWDIARDIVMWFGSPTPCGWVLDGYGGLHAFGAPSPVQGSAYWPGWDIARALGG